MTSTSNTGTSKNTLVFAGEGQSVLNPLLNNTDDIQSIIFSGLMKYDGNNKPVADLAESYEYDENTKTYTFHLREGVKWHDGEVFTADDVVFTYSALTEDKSYLPALPATMKILKVLPHRTKIQ
ncbi:MAG: ABC transporter substrate-binding protein [Acutalibacteraceae bacterium]